MVKKEYNVKALVQDSIFSAICLTFILIFSLTSNNWKMYGFILVIMISVFYSHKPFFRSLICTITIFSLSFIFANPLNILIFVLPNCLMGAFSSKIVNTKFKFTLPILFLALAIYEAFLYSFVFLDKNIISYVEDIIYATNSNSHLLLGENRTILIYIIIAMLLCIVIVESVVYFVFFHFLNKKLKKFLI